MSLRKLNSFVLIAVLALAAVSCKKDSDSTIYPSLSGLKFQCPLFVAPNQVVTMTPRGVEHPEGKEVGYYWKVTPTMTKADTIDVFTHKFSDTLATFTVSCYAFAAGYSGSSYAHEVTVVKGGLNQSITKTGISESDPNVVDGDNVYYYIDVDGNTYNRTIKKFHYTGRGATSVTDQTTVKQSANFVKKGPDGRIYVAYGMYGLQIYELN